MDGHPTAVPAGDGTADVVPLIKVHEHNVNRLKGLEYVDVAQEPICLEVVRLDPTEKTTIKVSVLE